MNITVKNEYRVEAEISADEMERFETDFASLDYSSADTRAFLWKILDEIRADGIDIDMSGRVLIEAFDNGTGGCVIAFTVLPNGEKDSPCVKQLVKNVCDSALILSDDIQPLIDFSRAAGEVRSDLYFCDGNYNLFVFPDGQNKTTIARILPEFYGVSSGAVRLKLASCRERGRLIRAEDAALMLARLSAR